MPVVRKNFRDTRNVSGRRITRDQSLNQPARDKRSDIRVIENCIETILQILRLSLSRRQCDTIQNRFCAGVMVLGKSHHRLAIIRLDVAPRWRSGLIPIPAGENVRVSFHHVLVVSRNRLAVDIELLRAVLIEFVQANREQLHDLPRVILVWRHLRIAGHAEVIPHTRIQRYFQQGITEVTEGVAI